MKYRGIISAALALSIAAALSINGGTKEMEPQNNKSEADTTFEEKALKAGNPVLKGQFADPDIAVFNNRYYIYPTTDGFTGWSGTKFHCFSSDDLTNWKDEGVILDVATDDVKWAVGSAWAPCIAEKNGTYYFYFCAKLPDDNSCIGVATAKDPAGPYTAEPEPLITKKLCIEHKIGCGQAIDPSFFRDDDGSEYIIFGNGYANGIKLNPDMTSVDWDTIWNYTGAKDFRESMIVTKRNGVYHFTWSCDDTGSENYHINYGISERLQGPIKYQYTVLEKRADEGILGTGHHSILNIPGTDDYYIAYHRFFTPLGIYKDGFGFHRETCIDVLSFDPETGLMNIVTPTLQGVEPRSLALSDSKTDISKNSEVSEEDVKNNSKKDIKHYTFITSAIIGLIALITGIFKKYKK